MTFTAKAVFVALADNSKANLVAFYRRLFGEPTISLPQVYSEFCPPGLRLGIFQPKPDHCSEFTDQAGSISLCIEVPDLEAAMAELAALGCPMATTITVASHGREIYAYDPAGNRLILHESAGESPRS
jgi:predicted enzyme related to lactoylglutathione lyase